MPRLRFTIPNLRYTSGQLSKPRVVHKRRTFEQPTAQQPIPNSREFFGLGVTIIGIISAYYATEKIIARDAEVAQMKAHIRWLANEIRMLKVLLEEEDAPEDAFTYLFKGSKVSEEDTCVNTPKED